MTSAAEDRPIVGFDLGPVLRVARKVRDVVRRRRVVVSSVALAFVVVGVAAAVLLPRQYTSESRLLTRREFSMQPLTHPKRSIPSQADAPAQSATDLVMRREALVEVVRQTKLQERWNAHMPTIQRWKTALRNQVLRPLTAEQEHDALVGLLRDRLSASVKNDNVISIKVSWTNADDALAIVNAAQGAFLAEKKRLDVETIEQTTVILSRAVKEMNGRVKDRVISLDQLRSRLQGTASEVAAKAQARTGPDELRSKLLAYHRDRIELERQRASKIAELQLLLAQQSATLGERHPDRIATAEALARLTVNDGVLARSEDEEQRLKKAYVAAGGSADVLEESGSLREVTTPSESPDNDASVMYARDLLRIDVDNFEDLTSRLQDAELELATARAAFPYRFMVTQPAERARKADKPNVVMVVAGAVIAGLVAGVMTAVALELSRSARLHSSDEAPGGFAASSLAAA